MSRLIVVCGHISAGKTTLAERLARHFDGIHLSSDEIREELGGYGKANGRAVFGKMADRAENYLYGGFTVILDSTGMSHRFRALVSSLEDRYVTTVIRLQADEYSWKIREAMRADRSPLESSVYTRSKNAALAVSADFTMNTAGKLPDEVFAEALERLGK